MEIRYIKGNIFDQDVEAIVNPVNCVGVMGAGLAKQFKDRYPDNFNAYKEVCDEKKLHPGDVYMFEYANGEKPYFILNAATKGHWKESSNEETIHWCLSGIVVKILLFGINSIAIPKLGCGLGNLDWERVKAIYNRFLSALEDSDCKVIILE